MWPPCAVGAITWDCFLSFLFTPELQLVLSFNESLVGKLKGVDLVQATRNMALSIGAILTRLTVVHGEGDFCQYLEILQGQNFRVDGEDLWSDSLLPLGATFSRRRSAFSTSSRAAEHEAQKGSERGCQRYPSRWLERPMHGGQRLSNQGRNCGIPRTIAGLLLGLSVHRPQIAHEWLTRWWCVSH